MTIRERLEAIQKLENLKRGEDLPHNIYCCFPGIMISGDQVSFHPDGDFIDLEGMQEVTAWMVENFGLPKKAKK